MTGNDSGFRRAAARFSAEVEWALTRARRATRDAKAQSAEFRQRTEELTTQVRNGELGGLRRSRSAPTSADARADATRFRTDNGLPVPDLSSPTEPLGRRVERLPARPADDDFANLTVLFDVDKEPLPPAEPEPVDTGSPEPVIPAASEPQDDFSHERILLDATEETYRPGDLPDRDHHEPRSQNRR